MTGGNPHSLRSHDPMGGVSGWSQILGRELTWNVDRGIWSEVCASDIAIEGDHTIAL